MRELIERGTDADSLDMIGWYFAMRQNPAVGLNFAIRAVQAEPGCGSCWDTAALLYFQAGKVREALTAQERDQPGRRRHPAERAGAPAPLPQGGRCAVTGERPCHAARLTGTMADMYRDEASLPCPSCPGELESSIDSLRCTRCSGTWISHGDMNEIVSPQSPAPSFEPVESTDRRRRCPMCREWLETVRARGVVLDRCAAHGLWFDYQEYRAFRSGVE